MEKVYFVEKSGRKRVGEYHNCEYCGAKFIRRKYPDSQWNKRQKSCSTKCSHLLRRNRQEIVCCWCNKSFERVKSSLKKYNFCSRECKDFAQSLDGDFKEIQPSHYGLGKHTEYRKKAFEMYPHVCEVCDYGEHSDLLQVHHIDGDRKNNAIKNLVILCPTCHWSITIKKATFTMERKYTWGI